LTGIAEIYRLEAGRRVYQTDQTLGDIDRITKPARLVTLPVQGRHLTIPQLPAEVGDYAARSLRHAWSRRVQNPPTPDVDFVLAVIVGHQRLRETLAFVVTGTQTDGIDIAPVAFRLRMDQRVAINFRRRRLKDARAHALRETEHVDGAHDAGLDRLHRI